MLSDYLGTLEVMYSGLDLFEEELKKRGTQFFFGEERCPDSLGGENFDFHFFLLNSEARPAGLQRVALVREDGGLPRPGRHELGSLPRNGAVNATRGPTKKSLTKLRPPQKRWMEAMWKDPAVDLYKLPTDDHRAFILGLAVGDAPYNLVHEREKAAAAA